MVFARGDVPDSVALQGTSGPVEAQVDRLASWPDGSLKHARVTVMEAGAFDVVTSSAAVNEPEPIPAIDFLARVTIGGEVFTATLPDPSMSTGGLLSSAYEMPAVPLLDATGAEHPHLALKAWVWFYPTTGAVEVIATIENCWAKVAGDNVVTDRIELSIDGEVVSQEDGVTVWRWSRTRATRLWHGTPVGHAVQYDLAYLRATGAVPNYDPELVLTDTAVSDHRTQYEGSPHGLMGATVLTADMGATGGRPEIGPLPVWATFPVLTNDPDALALSMDIDDSSAVWPIHLRDRDTDGPLSVQTYPSATTNVAARPNAELDHPIPRWSGPHDNAPFRTNPPHEPGFAYVSYLLTTDPFYLEEMTFWENWNALWLNQSYRDYEQNVFVKSGQVRNKAWTLRTLGYLAWIIPDDHSMKPELESYLTNNREWLVEHRVNNPDYGPGFETGLMPYYDGNGIAPWQDDFYTWAIGNMVRLGYEEWRPVLEWKARFVVHRMQDACYQFASIYSVRVRDDSSSAFYPDWPTMLQHSASAANLSMPCGTVVFGSSGYQPGDLSGYPWSAQGFPANMQPALATAVDSGVDGAAEAWAQYARRPTKQRYGSYPNWAIVPAM